MASPRIASLRETATALAWGLASGSCAAVAWSAGMILVGRAQRTRLDHTPPASEIREDSLILMAIGGMAALIASMATQLSVRLLIKGPRGRLRPLAIVGFSIAGIVAGALSLPMATALRGWLPLPGSESVAWGVAGFVAGFLGREFARCDARDLRLNVVIGWALVPAIVLGGVWRIGLALNRELSGYDFAQEMKLLWEPEVFVQITGMGALIGLTVGTVAAFVLLGHREEF
ncbi:MAG TPA: hypothetical protein VLM40_06405, partial [Gemmata sp.]|nr:hypothetical protein [Gemmata sp.]